MMANSNYIQFSLHVCFFIFYKHCLSFRGKKHLLLKSAFLFAIFIVYGHFKMIIVYLLVIENQISKLMGN